MVYDIYGEVWHIEAFRRSRRMIVIKSFKDLRKRYFTAVRLFAPISDLLSDNKICQRCRKKSHRDVERACRQGVSGLLGFAIRYLSNC